MLRRIIVSLACGLLVACAAPAPVVGSVPQELFDDAHFGAPSEPIDVHAVFALDDEMRRYLQQEIEPAARHDGPRRALIDALHKRGRLQLDYEASVTRNAREAFQARSGNCLSLVIMTGALAREMGMEVTYQTVGTDELWSRVGDMYFLSGHVNLLLGRRLGENRATYDSASMMTVDFIRPEDTAGQRVTAISESTVLAMYMNNRAAESLIRGRTEQAYWYAREAVRLEPSFLSAYNTLGVVYLRHGDPRRAEQTLRFVARHQPDNPQVLDNLAQALRETGQTAEAALIQVHLARLEPFPPFHFFNLGQVAIRKGDYATARTMFERELKRAPDYHEFHYWLAVADAQLGRLDEAEKELARAMEGSTQRTDRDLYAAKLDRLKAAESRARAL